MRSEHISNRLWAAMLVVVLSVLLIGMPLIVGSYRSYQKSSDALLEIQNLKIVAELANQISKERAPSNNAMSSSPEDVPRHLEALQKYRAEVDLQIQSTLQKLEQSGQHSTVQELEHNFLPVLMKGRQAIDQYIALPYQQRTMRQMDDAVLAMFAAWDQCYEALQGLVRNAAEKDAVLSSYYTLILLLADLRDQAGRTASNVMAPVTFNERMPEDNLASSMQTLRQTQYLWKLVGVIQPADAKTDEFQILYQQVKVRFLDRGLPIITGLMHESIEGQPFSISGPELTAVMVDKFATVVDLQNHILETSISNAAAEKNKARQELIYAILMVLVSLLTVLLTMIYARKWVFEPLILAREQLFALARAEQAASSSKALRPDATIFDAINRLQLKLQQREALEFQLKHIAHSDSLTGVANRFALDEYIKLIENQPDQFQNSCVILVDIDNFKQVNDNLGHIMGDAVIRTVAECLENTVRTSDLLVRYGGDEFLVLMENVSLPAALKIAEKIRKAVLASELFASEAFDQVKVSISAGVAVGAPSWMELLAQADEALFRAKAKGKNTVSD